MGVWSRDGATHDIAVQLVALVLGTSVELTVALSCLNFWEAPALMPTKEAGGNPLSIQEARNHAVEQAQQEGCTANFRIFDSPTF